MGSLSVLPIKNDSRFSMCTFNIFSENMYVHLALYHTSRFGLLITPPTAFLKTGFI